MLGVLRFGISLMHTVALCVGKRRQDRKLKEGFARLQQENEALRLLSRPELMSLRSEAKNTDSVVILTDASGTVLDVVGSAEFAGEAARVALQPGVAWSEMSTGTNAIGTAMAERHAIAVHGGEHFFEPHGILHCAASPIFDPYGKLAGVLDMSGHASAEHTHALGLVRLAVEQIEHRFFNRGFEDRTVVRFHRSNHLLGTPREGVLVFEGEKLIAGNRRALSLLGMDRVAFRKTRREDLFEALGQPAAARRAYAQAVEIDPGAAFALNNLCYVEMNAGHVTVAADYCARALTVDPAMVAARNNLAFLQASSGDLAAAEAQLTHGPTHATTLYNIGMLRLVEARYAEAASAFDQAVAAQPSMILARQRLVQARKAARAAEPSR